MIEKNLQISQQKIQNILTQLSLSPKDHLPQQQLSAIIAKLNQGPFDQQTFQQIWDQCQLNSKGQVRLSQFMQYFLKAETILLENIKNTNISISKLEAQKPDENDYSQLHSYRQQLDALYQQKKSLKISLQIIRKPFQHLLSTHIISLQKNNIPQQDQQHQLFEYNVNQTAGTLSKIMYLTFGLLILTWISSQLVNQFVDMTLCIVILSSFAFQTISRKIVKLNLIILAFSFVYGIIWLLIYSFPLWSLKNNYDFPSFTGGYLKFSVCMTILAQIIKLVLIYFYLTQLHINQLQTYSLSFFYKSIQVQVQPSPPQYFHPLSYALRYIFNPRTKDSDQIAKQKADSIK